jgi:dTDP-4-dehydrorhamnose reductase
VKLLIAGAGGMLGSDVLRAGERAGHELVGLTRADLDVRDARAVERALARAGADALVNCAAWTDVDGAERDREGAFAVNAAGAGNLARAAAARGMPLVHVSTDYVFDGTPPRNGAGRPRPYVESDPTGPISAYGASKRAGEHEVLGASPQHTVVRSAWLFGVDGRNFVATMLTLAQQHEAVQVVTDQIGCPTWTGHLAPALLGVLERGVSGLVHLAGGGQTSWNGFAQEIFRQAQRPCRVEAVFTDDMPRPARRPAWSVLASEREDVLPMPDWRDGLAGYLAARAGVRRA